MKTIAQLFLFLFVFGASAGVAHAAENCEGCSELEILSGQLGTMEPGVPQATKWIRESQKALKRLPTKARLLSKAQVEQVTYLLASSKGNDPDFAIIDSNIHLFKANEKAFFVAFRQLKDKSVAQYLEYGLSLKLGELEEGKRK